MDTYRVLKFKLSPKEQTISLPKGAHVFSAIAQEHDIVIYANCPEGVNEVEDRHFVVLGTGWVHGHWPGSLKPIGTVLMNIGLVLHVFERVGEPSLDMLASALAQVGVDPDGQWGWNVNVNHVQALLAAGFGQDQIIALYRAIRGRS